VLSQDLSGSTLLVKAEKGNGMNLAFCRKREKEGSCLDGRYLEKVLDHEFPHGQTTFSNTRNNDISVQPTNTKIHNE
jgi:hypothetical protein